MATLANPQAGLAAIAEKDLGLEESPPGSNRGPQIAKFFAADNYVPGSKDEGYAWCACAVSYWVQVFLRTAGREFYDVAAPRLCAAFDFNVWAQRNGCLVFTPAQIRKGIYRHQRGDIVVYGFSHVGIVSSVNTKDTNFTAIEGNSNDDGSREGYEVVAHARTLGAVESGDKAQGRFIRLSPIGKVVRS